MYRHKKPTSTKEGPKDKDLKTLCSLLDVGRSWLTSTLDPQYKITYFHLLHVKGLVSPRFTYRMGQWMETGKEKWGWILSNKASICIVLCCSLKSQKIWTNRANIHETYRKRSKRESVFGLRQAISSSSVSSVYGSDGAEYIRMPFPLGTKIEKFPFHSEEINLYESSPPKAFQILCSRSSFITQKWSNQRKSSWMNNGNFNR